MPITPSHVAGVTKILASLYPATLKGYGPVPLPDRSEFTYATVKSIIQTDYKSLGGDSALGLDIIQVDCWNMDYESAFTARTAVKALLTGYSATIPGTTLVVQGSEHHMDAELYDGTRKLHQLITRIKMWFEL